MHLLKRIVDERVKQNGVAVADKATTMGTVRVLSKIQIQLLKC